MDYFVYEDPISKKSYDTENPDAGNPDAGNPALLSNECIPSNEKEVVCYQTPVGSDFKKISVIKKKHPDGHEVEISLQDIFSRAVLENKKLSTDEIHEAWVILSDYSGLIRDPLRFIEGTVENIRNKKKSKFLAKNKEIQACTTNKTIPEFKQTSLADGSPERPSLQFLLEQAGMA